MTIRPKMSHMLWVGIVLTELIFLGLTAWYGWAERWSSAFVAGQAFVLGLVPLVLRYCWGLLMHAGLHLSIVLFLFGSLVLGELAQFYSMWWWDILLHTFATCGLALLGLCVMYLGFNRAQLQAAPLFSALLAFSFALMAAVLWEIFEFVADLYLEPDNLMQPNNFDTMTDLIVGSVGAAIVSVIGFWFLRKREDKVLSRLIQHRK